MVTDIDIDGLLIDLRRHLQLPDTVSPRFLARGEYSINYVVPLDSAEAVVRLVTGSQMRLSIPEQVAYEAHALRLLDDSGRTPRLIALESEPVAAPYPFLVETYLPGRPLDYATDLTEAAGCIADIHQVRVPDGHQLQVHADPGPSIVRESREWAEAYLEWDEAPALSHDALRQAFAVTEAGMAESEFIFTVPDLVIVNYDLNTHNFIVDDAGGERVWLLDWEKARIAPAVQDLAHFLLPTTTLWRDATARLLTSEHEERFLDAYLSHRPHLDRERFMAQLLLMKRLIALRAVSWCSWAIHAATTGTRVISNEETLAKSRMYLEPEFLDGLFGTRDA